MHNRAGADTLVLEMITSAWSSVMEEASILGQVYVNIFLPPAAEMDMIADAAAVLHILHQKKWFCTETPETPEGTEQV